MKSRITGVTVDEDTIIAITFHAENLYQIADHENTPSYITKHSYPRMSNDEQWRPGSGGF